MKKDLYQPTIIVTQDLLKFWSLNTELMNLSVKNKILLAQNLFKVTSKEMWSHDSLNPCHRKEYHTVENSDQFSLSSSCATDKNVLNGWKRSFFSATWHNLPCWILVAWKSVHIILCKKFLRPNRLKEKDRWLKNWTLKRSELKLCKVIRKIWNERLFEIFLLLHKVMCTFFWRKNSREAILNFLLKML